MKNKLQFRASLILITWFFIILQSFAFAKDFQSPLDTSQETSYQKEFSAEESSFLVSKKNRSGDTNIFSFITPMGSYGRTVSLPCRSSVIGEEIISSQDTSKTVRDYLKRCGKELSRNRKIPFVQLFKGARSGYNYENKSLVPFAVQLSKEMISVGFLSL